MRSLRNPVYKNTEFQFLLILKPSCLNLKSKIALVILIRTYAIVTIPSWCVLQALLIMFKTLQSVTTLQEKIWQLRPFLLITNYKLGIN